MSVDLAQALQDFSATVDFIRKTNQQIYDVYVNPTPKDVTIYGPDGQVISSVPNRAKLVAEFEEWKDSARIEFGAVNLLKNTRFSDSDGNNFPDGFYTYYSASNSSSVNYTLITPDKNAAEGSDAKIASKLLAKAFTGNEENLGTWTHWDQSQWRVLKVEISGFVAGDRWSLNQSIRQISAGSVITRGVVIYLPSLPEGVKIGVWDNPGGETIDGLDSVREPGFWNLYAVQKATASGHLGFLLLATNQGASPVDLTFYVGFPVFVLGHTGNLRFVPEVNK